MLSAAVAVSTVAAMRTSAAAKVPQKHLGNDRSGSVHISRSFQVPTLLVAVGVELREGSETAANGGQSERFLRLGAYLGHDAKGAIDELVDAPELLGPAGKGRQRVQFAFRGRSQRAIRSSDGDFEIRRQTR